MDTVFLGLGGNLGDREQNLKLALYHIERSVGQIQSKSSIYETQAWGKTDQPNFLNCVVAASTHLNPNQVLLEIQKIETDLGRMRIDKWGARTMDIDILFYNDEIWQTESLIIPHALIEKRKFVLFPMCEIAPDYIHPGLEKTIQDLVALSDDPSDVKRIPNFFNDNK